MDPLSIVFYGIMIVIGLVVLYFLASFIYLICLNVLKASVLFYPLLIAVPIAFLLWSKGQAYIGIPLLIVGFVLSLVIYPKKKKVDLGEFRNMAMRWPDTPRGKILTRIDKAIAK